MDMVERMMDIMEKASGEIGGMIALNVAEDLFASKMQLFRSTSIKVDATVRQLFCMYRDLH